MAMATAARKGLPSRGAEGGKYWLHCVSYDKYATVPLSFSRACVRPKQCPRTSSSHTTISHPIQFNPSEWDLRMPPSPVRRRLEASLHPKRHCQRHRGPFRLQDWGSRCVMLVYSSTQGHCLEWTSIGQIEEELIMGRVLSGQVHNDTFTPIPTPIM